MRFRAYVIRETEIFQFPFHRPDRGDIAGTMGFAALGEPRGGWELPPSKRPGPEAKRGSAHRTERGLRRRTLSQNFLKDSHAARQFLGALDLDASSLVLEVGAGDGALTGYLADMVGHVIAYEIDPEHARQLRARMAKYPNVDVTVGDFLAARPPETPFHVVGNVPFSRTSDIVDWCLSSPSIISATMITQLEYAKKRAGAYGRWSLVTIRSWPYFRWELRGRISKTQFRPVPRVDAGILHIAQRAQPLIPQRQAAAWARMVEVGFGGVGGSLYASLARYYPPRRVAGAFRRAQLDRDTIVAFAHPDQWLILFSALVQSG